MYDGYLYPTIRPRHYRRCSGVILSGSHSRARGAVPGLGDPGPLPWREDTASGERVAG